MMFCDTFILPLVFHSALSLKTRCVHAAVSFASNCWYTLCCICAPCPPCSQILPQAQLSWTSSCSPFTAIFRGGNWGMESGGVLPGRHSWGPNSGRPLADSPSSPSPCASPLPSASRAVPGEDKVAEGPEQRAELGPRSSHRFCCSARVWG